ncbi:hypothetical protein PGT21_013706 [Puccinia graminis f. sp. tritici]|uniref:Uncharacterized protein n=1 Tax=Puccinia graminis f. sp. tritici TaxID=56615 RepID=A0A5B0MTT7_PUCGR|nr:hypothetical protein PGT21_013706 [Puccinia graminis f. sp. tritici]
MPSTTPGGVFDIMFDLLQPLGMAPTYITALAWTPLLKISNHLVTLYSSPGIFLLFDCPGSLLSINTQLYPTSVLFLITAGTNCLNRQVWQVLQLAFPSSSRTCSAGKRSDPSVQADDGPTGDFSGGQ